MTRLSHRASGPDNNNLEMASAYTPSQLDAYEAHVQLPRRFHRSSNPALDISYLTALHVHQISAVPYENLILHYSKEHAVSLDPQVLYKKIVTDARGRGGYCMENSILFNHVLRGLGFQVYTAGVRNRSRIDGVPGGDYNGWVHIVNIVTLADGSKYMIDVGFGGDGATSPLPLIPNQPQVNLGSQEVQLAYSTIPPQTTSTKHWIYQYRNKSTQEWNSFYAFPEYEFFPQDFEVMNFFTSQSIGGMNFQTRTVLIVRFLRGENEEEREKIVGKVMLVNGEVKRNMGGKTEVVTVCTSEGGRIEALGKYFGIRLTEEEKEGVKGRNVELLGP